MARDKKLDPVTFDAVQNLLKTAHELSGGNTRSTTLFLDIGALRRAQENGGCVPRTHPHVDLAAGGFMLGGEYHPLSDRPLEVYEDG